MSTETLERDSQAQGSGRPFFSCRGLNAYYGDSYIVQNVSFDIPEGQILALLGRNGAGKTSTLRTIARASSPELRSGEIWLAGEPLHTKANFAAARAGVQLVQEDRRIIQGLTVEENLELAQISARLPRTWVFSNNHFAGHAPDTIRTLASMLG